MQLFRVLVQGLQLRAKNHERACRVPILQQLEELLLAQEEAHEASVGLRDEYKAAAAAAAAAILQSTAIGPRESSRGTAAVAEQKMLRLDP